MSPVDESSLSSGFAGADPLLGCVRRLGALADRASDEDEALRALARELLATLGAEEVHVHVLAVGDEAKDAIVVYLFGGEGRLSYTCPRSERPPAVGWVASTGKSFLARDEPELRAGVPRLAGARSALLVPLVMQGEVTAVVLLASGAESRFDGSSVERACALIDQVATVLALIEARAEAGTDAVTGCMNHRAMRRRLEEEVARAQRVGGTVSCLLIDLDDFKQVNDVHGHQAGDEVLRSVAASLMGQFRAFDRVARYGGDEFVVILPEADLSSAVAAGERAIETLARLEGFAERLRHRTVAGGAASGTVDDDTDRQAARSRTGGDRRARELRSVSADAFEAPLAGVAASIGAAQWRQGMDVEDLLHACDAALLQSKRRGKWRVTAAR